MSVTDVSLDPAADAFRWGALGKTGWRVVRSLVIGGAATMGELQERLQMPRNTLRRTLRRLNDERVVELRDGLWHPAAVDLQAVARSRGTDGAAERQREDHRVQRDAYRELLAFRRRHRNRPPSRRPSNRRSGVKP